MSIDRQKVIDTAQKFAAKGQYDKAIVEYMRIVREDPSDVRVLLKIGDLQVRKGAKDDAVATYSRVANGYDQQGFYLKAIAVYKQILSIDPNLTELYSKLAELYVKYGAVPEAIAQLDILAARFARGEQWEKLVEIFRRMVQIDPSNLPSHIKLAELLSKLNRPDEAAKEFEAGCALLKDLGRIDDWSKVAERLLFHRPADIELAKQLARHYIDRQDAKRALPKLQVAFKSNPKDVPTLELLAQAFRELGQLPKTISVLKEIARIHQDGGAHDKKLETWKRVLELSPNDADAKEGLRGGSRLARRPSVPPTGAGAEPAAARKPSSPAMPAAAGPPRKLSSPALPRQIKPSSPGMPAATSSPPISLPPEELDEIVVVDADDEAAYDDAPAGPTTSMAKPAGVRPPAMNVAVPPASPPPRVAPPPFGAGQLPVVAPPASPSAARPPAKEQTGPIPLAAARAVPPPGATPNRAAPAAPQAMVPPPRVDPGAEIGRMLGEADIFLKYGLRPKALAHLQRAIELDPSSIDAHVRLRDLYAESGELPNAAVHSTQIALVLADVEPETALAEVTHALELDPDNAEAFVLYQRLGGAMDTGEESLPPPEVNTEFTDQTTAEGFALGHPPAHGGDDAAAYADPGYDEGSQTHGSATEAPHAAEGADEAHGGSARDIEEGLDEAEFFVTQGLYDEARDSLSQLLAAHPNHPLVLERFEELEAMLAAQQAPAEGEDQSFALAEKLAEEVDNVQQSGGAQFADGGEMIDVETVFEQFKRGIEKTVSADDAETHYDLGIAYKEMGLTEDAIGEFKIAAQAPNKKCLSEMMIGLCFIEKNDAPGAIDHFKRALQTSNKTEREEMGLYFELGNAYEAVGDLSEAMYFFQKVEKRDPKFRGVTQRVARLAPHVTGSGTRQPPATEMDEVDRAFDELLKG